MTLPSMAALAVAAALLLLAVAIVVFARARGAVRAIFREFTKIGERLVALDAASREVGQRTRAIEERTQAIEGRTQAIEERTKATEEGTQAIEERTQAIEERTKAIEERTSDIRAAVGLTQLAVWADSAAEFLAPCNWTDAIAEASRRRPESISAEAFLRRRATGSQPVDLLCTDGNVYVTKSPWRGHPEHGWLVFVEYVVGRLGRLIGAPIPDVALVSIPPALIARHPDPEHGMGHLLPGEGHGLRFIDGLGERCNEIKHVAANRERFASLAILQGWTQATDRQFLYETQSPHRVYSTDHGRYLDSRPLHIGDPRLLALAHLANDIIESCELNHEELVMAAAPLHAVTASQIVEILAIPPDSWGVDLYQRAVIGRYLRLRQFHLLGQYGPMKSVSHRRGD